MDVVYYVSGHGFGHALRSFEVMRQMAAQCKGIRIHVRTTAPADFFEPLGPHLRLSKTDIDSGAVEIDPLALDVCATLQRVRRLYENRDAVIETESDYVRSLRASLIVSDIPYLAADIAFDTSLPCVMLGNFTWDWIYEPFFVEHRANDLRDFVEGCYAKATLWLRLPFSHTDHHVPCAIDSPLIARRSPRTRTDIRRQLAVSDDQTVVLVGLRGGLAEDILHRVASDNADMVLVCLQPAIVAHTKNILPVSLSRDLAFLDLLAASDAVVSKLGYGIVSDCIANQTRLLWPARQNFREDEIMGHAAARFMPCREISRAEFATGMWRDSLQALLQQPRSTKLPEIHGAAFCAQHILRMCKPTASG